MNYELAKELKEAGFPQKIEKGSHYWHIGGADSEETPERFYQIASMDIIKKIHIASPNLSELIEACGEHGFESLIATYNGQWQRYFIATSAPRTDSKTGEGSNPEEAVANLWLALNKKSHE